MFKRVGEVFIVIMILVVLVAMLLPAIRNTYVPTPAQIDQRMAVAPFQVQPIDVEGVYGNYDIDVFVFRYTTEAVDKIAFTTTLDKQAFAAGWTRLPNKGSSICYERITPKGSRMFCGAEQVRVRFDHDTKRVSVGWVQGDDSNDVTSFSELRESDWAEREVWPKLIE